MSRKLFVHTRALTSAALIAITILTGMLSLPFPQSAQAHGEKTVHHGYFYDRPSDGTSTETAAKRGGVVILGRGVGWYRDLKSAGFSGIGLEYLMANEVNGPWTTPGSSCDSSHVPPQNTVAYNKGDFCKYVHPNESWFLHNSKGQRLYGRRGDGKGFNYHMNPASEGWRRFHKSRVLRDLIGDSTQAKKGFDGIYLDNVALATYKLRHQITNSDGKVREYSSDSAYRSAALGQLSGVRSAIGGAGPLWANLIDDRGVSVSDVMSFVDKLDGFLNESWAMTYPSESSHFSATQWNNVLTIAEQTLSKGKRVFSVVQGSKDNYDRQRFGLASYLLVTNTTRHYFRYAKASSYNSWWQYDNYNVALGAPKGKRYQVGSAWRRDFECGYVTADPTNRSGKIVQTTCSSYSTTTSSTTTTSSIGLPASFEVENYKAGGSGVGYYDTTSGNSGGAYRNDSVDIAACSSCRNGHAVGYVKAGEWLAYDVSVPSSGYYKFRVRVATPYSGKKFHIKVDGTNVTGSVSVPNTGSWQTWSGASTTIRLSSGKHTIRLVAENDSFNLDAVDVTKVD